MRRKPGSDHRRFAAAGWADDRRKAVAIESREQLLDRDLSPKEEGGVLLAKVKQAAIGADGGACACNVITNDHAWGSPRIADAKAARSVGSSGSIAEIDPGILAKKSQHRIGAGEQHRDDWKSRFAGLPFQRQVHLALLPGPQLAGTDAHGHCVARPQRLLECLGPWLPGNEIPAVKED